MDIPLRLYNSLGRTIQEFTPIHPDAVRIYSCGPTVYNYAHIGNLRAYIFVDILKRTLQWKKFDVLHVMNITDVGHLTSDADEGEDKMEEAAQQERRSVWDIAAFYTKQFQEDIALLNIQPPSVWCKATDHIQEMINFVLRCEQGGFTYLLEDGLYFDTSKVKNYGELALLDLAGQEEGARVAPRSGKRNLSDFALWRRSPTDKQRLMEWHSPWGTGAPGWHLECSAMSLKYLGVRFDIHTGGIDHRQIHHCNEIAQNQAFTNSDSGAANFWVHNEFLNMVNQKMSKSTGQFIRLKTLIDSGIHPLVYRYFCLIATYRTPLDFSTQAITAAKSGFTRLLKRIEVLKKQSLNLQEWLPVLVESKYSRGASTAFLRNFIENEIPDKFKEPIHTLDAALSDDLNTPQALALVSSIVSDSNIKPDIALRLLASFDLALGLQFLELNSDDLNLRPANASIKDEEIQELITHRNTARANRDFKTADEFRDKLLKHGITLMDNDQITTWEWLPKIEL